GAIISVLLGGPHRFNEILSAIPGISDRLLTERLRELEAESLIVRRVESGSPVRVEYELTCAGAELKDSMDSLGRWAEKWIGLPTA
ncbi:MAG TPA: helix-turn-helix domain-containing protein, partial [Candidatus Baltobacteraceae bacterium]|nr:helix-turn-helix domain-containing protein [Candidatus Baltobacteraceae bacterium]